MVTKHIQDWHQTESCPKQFWSPRDGYPNKQSRIRSTEDCKSFRHTSLVLDEPLRGTKEIIVGFLAIATFGGLMPLGAEFRSAPYVGQCKQASHFNEKGNEDAELRRGRNSKSTVGSHNRRMGS